MKAMVLFSGGVDSTTALALAVEKYGASEVLALSIYYGQKHKKELEAAQKVVNYYGVAWKQLDLTTKLDRRNSAGKLCRTAGKNQWCTGFHVCAVPERSVSGICCQYGTVKRL